MHLNKWSLSHIQNIYEDHANWCSKCRRNKGNNFMIITDTRINWNFHHNNAMKYLIFSRMWQYLISSILSVSCPHRSRRTCSWLDCSINSDTTINPDITIHKLLYFFKEDLYGHPSFTTSTEKKHSAVREILYHCTHISPNLWVCIQASSQHTHIATVYKEISEDLSNRQ